METKAEQALVAVNRELLKRFAKKIQTNIACVRGEATVESTGERSK